MNQVNILHESLSTHFLILMGLMKHFFFAGQCDMAWRQLGQLRQQISCIYVRSYTFSLRVEYGYLTQFWLIVWTPFDAAKGSWHLISFIFFLFKWHYILDCVKVLHLFHRILATVARIPLYMYYRMLEPSTWHLTASTISKWKLVLQ